MVITALERQAAAACCAAMAKESTRIAMMEIGLLVMDAVIVLLSRPLCVVGVLLRQAILVYPYALIRLSIRENSAMMAIRLLGMGAITAVLKLGGCARELAQRCVEME